MDEKILSFLDSEKGDAEAPPLEPEILLQQVQCIPEDVAQEYITFANDYMSNVLLIKNIISANGNPHLCRHLFEREAILIKFSDAVDML